MTDCDNFHTRVGMVIEDVTPFQTHYINNTIYFFHLQA